MVDSTTGLLTPNALATLTNSINQTLNKGELMNPVSYGQLRDQSRSVKVSKVMYEPDSRSVSISSIVVDAASIVYFVLQPSSAPDPNNEQVMNCLDGNGITAIKCFRLLTNGA